ncbi:MAG: endonuclease/exonuclease/phosphatase family protein [Silicimonas sp.]|nr:endonuclease/exonuclease/phosphatase family protein [Silicimonas sp.]
MGFSSRFAFHAWHRHGTDRHDDHRETQDVVRRRRQRGAFAGLIAALVCPPVWADTDLRIAVFHTELSRDGPGLLLRDILSDKDEQVAAFARVVGHIAPDVLVLADVDFDHGQAALNALAETIGGYRYRFASLPNTGRRSGHDLNGDGRFGRSEDAWGYGEFTGQGGMAILSKLPLGQVKDYSSEKWSDLPDTMALPGTHPEQPLSTRSHWEVPVLLADGRYVTLLTWHATAPVFDGPEDRNGRRNHDEAAVWVTRLNSDPPQNVIVAGFANLDPLDGDGRPEALTALLGHPLLRDVYPESQGGDAAGRADKTHRSPAQFDTVAWPQDGPGNLRVDYVLPSRAFEVIDAGVFWPLPDQFLASEVARASRHRMVWVDVRLPER